MLCRDDLYDELHDLEAQAEELDAYRAELEERVADLEKSLRFIAGLAENGPFAALGIIAKEARTALGEGTAEAEGGKAP